jgi:glycosyltransferase involved in cell wall biosynthesis
MNRTDDALISIVVPVYQEDRILPQLLETILHEMKRVANPFEIIIVDDGSGDKSWPILKELSATISQMICLRLSRNFGKEFAIVAGLDHSKGDAVIIMDGDLQHPPSLIPLLIQRWKESSVEIVEAVRSFRGEESKLRSFGASLFYWLMNIFSGLDLKNVTDFKLIDRKVVNAIRQMGDRLLFFRGMSMWVGFDRFQIPFEVPERPGGKSRWSLRRLFGLATSSITVFSSIPLQLVTILGIVFFVISTIIGSRLLVLKFRGVVTDGITTQIFIQLIMGSFIMLSLGLIGKYLSNIYTEVKQRPHYIIRDSINLIRM